MCDVLIEITHPPFGRENAFAAVYVAKVCTMSAQVVTVLLRGDGVFTGLAGQSDPGGNIHLPPIESQIREILELDVRVAADSCDIKKRAILPGDLIDGIEVLSTKEMHSILVSGPGKVVTF